MMRGSILASALGTFFGSPLTFPLIWITTFNIGNWFLGTSSDIGRLDLAERLDELRVYFLYDIGFAFEMLFYTLWPIVKTDDHRLNSGRIGFLACRIFFDKENC